MTPRSIRRAAERKANKLARKTSQQLAQTNMGESETEDSLTPAIPPAEAANATLSASTSVLTGQITLLPNADAAQYDQQLRDFQNEYQPVGFQESNLVQQLAECNWRRRQAYALESAIFAKGRIEFAAQFADHKPELRNGLIDVHTFLTYERQIRGLQLQEARLARRFEKATAELRLLQKDRRQKEARDQSKENGSVFSNREINPPVAAKQPATPQPAAAQNPQIQAKAA